MLGSVLPGVARDGFAVEAIHLRKPVAVDVYAVAAPVELVPAPERAEDAVPDAEADARERRTVNVARRRREIVRGIIRIGPCAINHARVIVRHVDDARIRRLDYDLASLDAHDLLRRRPQTAGVVSLPAQALHGIHHIRLLRQEGVAELLRPLQLVIHHLDDARERHQRFDTGVPVHLIERRGEGVAPERGVVGVLEPAPGLRDLERIGRGHQDLAQQLIGIKRDRRQQLIDLSGVVDRGTRLRRSHLLRLRGLARRRHILILAGPAVAGRIAHEAPLAR